jgi:DNA polymerase III subunit beta
MKCYVQRRELLETLSRVKPAVAVRATLPVCQSILLRAVSGQIWLTATNLEVALSASCKALVKRQGAVAIPPSLLEGFLKVSKTEEIILSLASQNSLGIEAGEAKTVLHGFEAKDFPPVPKVIGLPTVVTGLASALKEISYAMAKEESRPVLTGVWFTPKDGKIELACADGFRLAVTTVKAKGTIDQMIVPGKAIWLIQQLMLGKVSIEKEKAVIKFISDGLILTTPAVQGTHPNYDQLIPRHGKPVTLDSQALRDALGMVLPTLGSSDIVRLQKKKANLIVSTQDEGLGETSVKVPAKGKGKIAFNHTYLKEMVARLEGKISLRITDPATPGLIKDGKTIHVLMPMFVQW